ncbi:MAG: hypothetical protein M1823_004451 [Watsoniomyces obsoletus]|nr:MAG: hypothetical protein M1823_004451 [Watsoniomyces obsoletus]
MAMEPESPNALPDSPLKEAFITPSINEKCIIAGESYAHYSPLPSVLVNDPSTECVLGIDEAGRGPVLGPMVYAGFYLPLPLERSLLATTHHFDDSKALTPAMRSQLMQSLCTSTSDLFSTCGWAVKVMSARDLSAGMLRPAGSYNLNAQAMDATIEIIKGILDQGVNVKEMYVDTIGAPATYQKRLQGLFPMMKVTVAKKADSLYPCVSAASVAAKVTRDVALEVLYRGVYMHKNGDCFDEQDEKDEGWGSGYPSDARCSNWLRRNMDPVFGWGNECRFSWSTAKDMLEGVGNGVSANGGIKMNWPDPDDDDDDRDMSENARLSDYFAVDDAKGKKKQHELEGWFGEPLSEQVF